MSMIGNYLPLTADEIDRLREDPTVAEVLAYPEDGALPPGAVDLDKAWHLIHFLIAGAAWEGEGPIAQCVLGGEELQGTDAGYGPFRLQTPEEVRATAKALAELLPEHLWERFDAQSVAAADIYPAGWVGSDEEKDYVLHNYRVLQQLYCQAAAESKGLLLYLA